MRQWVKSFRQWNYTETTTTDNTCYVTTNLTKGVYTMSVSQYHKTDNEQLQNK